MMKQPRVMTLLLFLTFFYFSLDAQNNKSLEGYILLKDGSRAEGKVKIGSITDREVKVSFQRKGTSKKRVYKPKELLGYGFESQDTDDLGLEDSRWIHFETIKVDYPTKPFGSTTVFVEREVEGTINLYCHYIEVRNNPKKPYRYVYYMKVEAGVYKKLEEDSFKNTAKKTFKDYPALAARIGKKDFLYRNLDRMVRDFNYWSVNQHDKNEYRVAMKE